MVAMVRTGLCLQQPNTNLPRSVSRLSNLLSCGALLEPCVSMPAVRQRILGSEAETLEKEQAVAVSSWKGTGIGFTTVPRNGNGVGPPSPGSKFRPNVHLSAAGNWGQGMPKLASREQRTPSNRIAELSEASEPWVWSAHHGCPREADSINAMVLPLHARAVPAL